MNFGGDPNGNGNNQGGNPDIRAGGFDIMSWYMEIPVVSRCYFTAAFATTAACALDVVSPFSLYYSAQLIMKGQVWRLFTTYLFFGMFSVDFLFHMYFLVRYCRLLEEGEFRGRVSHFVIFLIFGAACMTGIAPFVEVHFLGSSLVFMMIYVWGRRNEDIRMSFLGLFPFTAPYLPWVMLGFSVLLGNPAMVDVIGICVGHAYFFLRYVWPVIADVRGWRWRRPLEPPRLLTWACGDIIHEHQD